MDGRHTSLEGQSFHEQIQEAWLCRLAVISTVPTFYAAFRPEVDRNSDISLRDSMLSHEQLGAAAGSKGFASTLGLGSGRMLFSLRLAQSSSGKA